MSLNFYMKFNLVNDETIRCVGSDNYAQAKATPQKWVALNPFKLVTDCNIFHVKQ